MNRVFVFGAGASKHAGGPLIKDFMFEGMWYLCNQQTYNISAESFHKVFELVDAFYGTQFVDEIDSAIEKNCAQIQDGDKLHGISIEHLLSYIDLAESENNQPRNLNRSYANYKKALYDFIFETIQLETAAPDHYSRKKDGTMGHHRNLYDKLVDDGLDLSDTNSFVTFNYDLLLDQAVSINNHGLLGDYNVPFSDTIKFSQYQRILKGRRNETDVDILKLHGSLNWAVCTNCCAPYLTYYWEYPRIPDETCPQCGASLKPVLVPPTYQKGIWRFKFIAAVWRKATQIITKADEMVVIGYSFPDVDQEAKWLFRKALLNRNTRLKLILAEPSPDIRERIRRFFWNKVDLCQEFNNFKAYCKSLGIL